MVLIVTSITYHVQQSYRNLSIFAILGFSGMILMSLYTYYTCTPGPDLDESDGIMEVRLGCTVRMG